MDLLNLSVADLRRAAQIKEQIELLNDELSRLLSGSARGKAAVSVPAAGGGRRTMSAAGRAKIAAAAKARWAKVRAEKGGSAAPVAKAATTGGGKKRTMSPAARAKIAAAAKARWAKVRAEKGGK